MKSMVAAQMRRSPRSRVAGTRRASRERIQVEKSQSIAWAGPGLRPGCSSRTEGRPPRTASRGPAPRSKTIGSRSTAKAGWGSGTATGCRAAPGGDPEAGRRPQSAQGRPAGQDDPARRDRAGAGLDPDHAAAAVQHRCAEAPEARPFAQFDAGALHRERVGPEIPRRVDRAVGWRVAPAAMAVGGQQRGRSAASPAPTQRDRQAGRLLHGDPRATGPLVLGGDRQDEIAELAEARIGAVGCLLAG